MKKIAQIIAIQLVVTVALILCVEGVLRLFKVCPAVVVSPVFYDNLLGDFEPNLRVLNEMPKNYPQRFTTNSQGLRSLREISETKPAGVIRILCLGDSYTMGWGLHDEDTIPEQLLAELAKKYPGKRFEVINAGFLFSNVLDHIDYFRQKGAKLKPDLVIEQFCYNDIDTDMRRLAVARQVLRRDNPVYARGGANFAANLLRGSAIANLAAKVRATYFSSPMNSRPNMNGRDVPEGFAVKDDLNALLLPPTKEHFELFQNYVVFDENKVAEQKVFWDRYLQGVMLLKKEAQDAGAQFLFMAIPHEDQVKGLKNGHSAVFGPFFRDNGVNYLDLTQTFRAYDGKDAKALFLDADQHTSALGDALIAKALAERIVVPAADGGAPLGITPDAVVLSYADPRSVYVEFPKGAKEFSINPDFDKNFFTSVQAVTQTEFFADGGSSYFVSSKEPYSTLEITVVADKPLQHCDFVSFRRLYDDKALKNKVVLSYSFDGKTFLPGYTFLSDATQTWDAMEFARVREFVFPPDTKRLTLRFEFFGRSGLVFDDKPAREAYRRMELKFYPQP